MKKLLWLLRYFGSSLFGPRLPQIQVGYCGQLDHMVILIGNNMPTLPEVVANAPTLPKNGIIALLELWASDEDLLALRKRIVTGSMTGQGLCLAVNVAGTEGERIAAMMQQNEMYAFRVHVAILREVMKFRDQSGFAERARYWRTMREPLQQMLGSVQRFAPGGVDDGNVELFIIIDADSGEVAGASITPNEYEH